jgi:hypothetical protein
MRWAIESVAPPPWWNPTLHLERLFAEERVPPICFAPTTARCVSRVLAKTSEDGLLLAVVAGGSRKDLALLVDALCDAAYGPPKLSTQAPKRPRKERLVLREALCILLWVQQEQGRSVRG